MVDEMMEQQKEIRQLFQKLKEEKDKDKEKWCKAIDHFFWKFNCIHAVFMLWCLVIYENNKKNQSKSETEIFLLIKMYLSES